LTRRQPITRRRLLSLTGATLLTGSSAVRLLAQMGASATVTQVKPQTGTPVADFVDIAAIAGLSAVTTVGGEHKGRYLLETAGAGVALFDYDNDGWLDIFFVNGSTFANGSSLVNGAVLDHTAKSAPLTSHLYKNNRDGTFTDVTAQAGLTRQGWGQGVCVGDYDGDGWLDLFVTYYGRNVLYRNNRNGTFTDVTAASGLLTADEQYSTGAAFIDTNRTGRLDLFVTHYVAYDDATRARPVGGNPCMWRGVQVICGPRGFKGGRNTLYRNQGNGTFKDVSLESGVLAGEHYGFTPLGLDSNQDGWPDIYVASDSSASVLYRNNHDGTFTDAGLIAGVAYNEDGREQSGMGTDAADYDGDGLLDIIKTNFEQDTSTLYHNRGDGTFDDVTFAAGIGVNTSFVGWGTGFFDFNADGHPDIFMANGHVYPEVDGVLHDTSFHQRKILYRNRGDGTFEDVSLRSGPGILIAGASRGVAFGDIFNTGRMDIVINNMNDRPTLLRNFMPLQGKMLTIELKGTLPNRFAIGAHVMVQTGAHRQAEEVRSGGSFLSQNDLRLHFGLGEQSAADLVEVRWPDGRTQSLRGVASNQRLVLDQGTGAATSFPFLSEPPLLRSHTLHPPVSRRPR
jgi:hypothetical protein